MQTFTIHTTSGPQEVRRDGRTKDGRWLSAYALACGYLETFQTGAERLTLWQEHGAYHVRRHHDEEGRRMWDVAETLAEARRIFARERRDMKGQA